MSLPTTRASTGYWAWATVVGCALGSIVAGFVLFVEAPPPNRLAIVTGSKDGAYFRFAQRYAELLKHDGITLDIRTTKGSVENVNLLRDEDSDVYVGMVQTGIADPAQCEKLNSLCSLYREPLWIFYRGSETVDRLSQLIGRRVAIGPEGSGTRAIARQLLQANSIDETQADFIAKSGNDAAEALERIGQVHGRTEQQLDRPAVCGAAGVRLAGGGAVRAAGVAQAEVVARVLHLLQDALPELDGPGGLPPAHGVREREGGARDHLHGERPDVVGGDRRAVAKVFLDPRARAAAAGGEARGITRARGGAARRECGPSAPGWKTVW